MPPDHSSTDRCFPALLAKDGNALFDHYPHSLEELGKQPGTLALKPGKAEPLGTA